MFDKQQLNRRLFLKAITVFTTALTLSGSTVPNVKALAVKNQGSGT